MADADWSLPFARCVGMRSSEVLLLLNAHDGQIEFALPQEKWECQIDTAGKRAFDRTYPLQGRSLALLVKATSSGQARTDA
jgi:pullulanase/glycogen debranching enzyme